MVDLSRTAPSTNFDDETNPTGLAALRDYIGRFLYEHGVAKGANNQYYDPGTPAGPFSQPLPKPGDWPTVGGPGGSIDFGSNKRLAPQGLMTAPSHKSNDALARTNGFKDAAQMIAFNQRLRERTGGNSSSAPAQGGSMLEQLFAIHPSVLLNHVLDKWNAASGGQ